MSNKIRIRILLSSRLNDMRSRLKLPMFQLGIIDAHILCIFFGLKVMFLLLDLITHEILSLNMNFLLEIKGLKITLSP